jgi:hypothetical protein
VVRSNPTGKVPGVGIPGAPPEGQHDDGRSAPVTKPKATSRTCAYAVASPAVLRQLSATPAVVGAEPSQVRESIPSVPGPRLADHSQKRFAKTGIYLNMWPMGPQEQPSG